MTTDYYDFYVTPPPPPPPPPPVVAPPVVIPPPVVTPPTSPAGTTAGAIPLSYVSYAGAGTWNSGSSACRGYITDALNAIGLPVTNAWLNGFLTIAERESSYNAPQEQVNTYDSNAVGAIQSDGAPLQCSRGVAQCIPQTFSAYHAGGTSTKIYDPVANFAAAINYVRAVYGVKNDGSNLAQKVHQADPNHDPEGY